MDARGVPDERLPEPRQPGAAGARADTSAPGERRPLPEGIAIGDPSRLVEEIRRWESVGIDGINFMLNALEEIPHAEVLASLRLFASDVMPKFRP